MDKSSAVPFLCKESGTTNHSTEVEYKQLQLKLIWIKHRGELGLAAISFLLGRAIVFENMSPFAAAFFGVVLFLKREKSFLVMASLLAGNFFAPFSQPAVICVELGVIYVLFQAINFYEKKDLAYAPVCVLFSTFIIKMFLALLTDQSGWLIYLLAVVEVISSFILTFLFGQAVSVLSRKKKNLQLRPEEWVGLAILLASVLSGMSGWTIYGVTLSLVLACYLIGVAAFLGGPLVGASSGLVTGLVLSLSNLSLHTEIGLLAFGGLIAGLLHHICKSAAVLGFILGTSLFALFETTSAEAILLSSATISASILLFLTPRTWIKSISRFIPNTSTYLNEQQVYAQKVRDITAERIEKFSSIFRHLSRSFRQTTSVKLQKDKLERNLRETFLQKVQNEVCIGCHRQRLCWEKQFIDTQQLIVEMMNEMEKSPGFMPSHIPKSWGKKCVKIPVVLQKLKDQYEEFHHDLILRQQLQESRLVVADQLASVSQVMEDLVTEIRQETKQIENQETKIRTALDQLGLTIQNIEIINLSEGHIEIAIVHGFQSGLDECRKMIAPLLTQVLGEEVDVTQEQPNTPGMGLHTVTFTSAKQFEVETGVTSMAKGGDVLSGDSFNIKEMESGKYTVALSDGMGNGARARLESSAALVMLQEMLQAGIDERLAVKSVNSILLMRSPDEMFATVDLALIDLFSGFATMIKIGSTPSFIKRGKQIIPITANNVPIGILQDIEIDLLRVKLKPGDTLIMMTDGVLEVGEHTINKEAWIKRLLAELKDESPQQLADQLLDLVLKESTGKIKDDMTIMVTQIRKHESKWSTFHWTELEQLQQKTII